MLIKFCISIALPTILLAACSELPISEKGQFFDTEFTQSLEKIEIFIAGYETHVEDTSTEIVDGKSSAVLSLNCGASCYENNLEGIDTSLANARNIECYPTFFMQKFVLQSSDKILVFYLDFDGRQIKLEEQCYQLNDEYDFNVGALGFLEWRERA